MSRATAVARRTHEPNTTNHQQISIATAEKISSGDFVFRVERATLNRVNAEPGAVAAYARGWTLRSETTTVRVIVRDRFTGRYGTLDIPVISK